MAEVALRDPDGEAHKMARTPKIELGLSSSVRDYFGRTLYFLPAAEPNDGSR